MNFESERNFVKTYSSGNRSISCFFMESIPKHIWDDRWSRVNIEEKFSRAEEASYITNITSKYLKSGSLILEGGCGIGDKVSELTHHSFKAIGVDYAFETVEKIRRKYPHLDIRHGDLRRLEFDDEYFDGYWSLGVIEHYMDGFTPILEEMKRVLKKDGFAFVTFPVMNKLRKFKLLSGFYAKDDSHKFTRELFYQYILDPSFVEGEFNKFGFELTEAKYLSSVFGALDEIQVLRSLYLGINRVLSRYSHKLGLKSNLKDSFSVQPVKRRRMGKINRFLDDTLGILCGHMMLHVYRCK